MNKGVMPPSESVLRARIEVFKEVGISTEIEAAKPARSFFNHISILMVLNYSDGGSKVARLKEE